MWTCRERETNVSLDRFLVEQEGAAWRFRAPGCLTSGTVEDQRAFLKSAMDGLGSATAIVLDLSATEMVDSMGITLIVRLFRTCEARKLGFQVEGVNPDLLRLFKLFSLDECFEIRSAAA